MKTQIIKILQGVGNIKELNPEYNDQYNQNDEATYNKLVDYFYNNTDDHPGFNSDPSYCADLYRNESYIKSYLYSVGIIDEVGDVIV